MQWDNESGKEPQPFSSDKTWGALTEQEKEAAVILGYTETIWDNKSGSELQPASVDKHWIDLTICGECRRTLYRVSIIHCMKSDNNVMAILQVVSCSATHSEPIYTRAFRL